MSRINDKCGKPGHELGTWGLCNMCCAERNATPGYDPMKEEERYLERSSVYRNPLTVARDALLKLESKSKSSPAPSTQ